MNKQTRHKLLDVDFGLMAVTVYKGCIVSKLVGGYSVLGKKCITPQQVDDVISNACKVIDDSVVRVTGGFSVQNDLGGENLADR